MYGPGHGQGPERERSTLCPHEVDIYVRLLMNFSSGMLDLEPVDLHFLLRCFLAVMDFAQSAIVQHLSPEEANRETYEIVQRMVAEERGEQGDQNG